MRIITGEWLGLALMLACSAFAKEVIVPDETLVYKKTDEVELTLHVFNPEGHKPPDKRPAVVCFFGGGSAGGHVAACTGVIQGHEDAVDNSAIPSLPNAMILFNPVIDTTENGYGVGKAGKDRKQEISPCHQVRQGIPPTLIFHGTDDTTVPYENAVRFSKLMNDAGNRCDRCRAGLHNRKRKL